MSYEERLFVLIALYEFATTQNPDVGFIANEAKSFVTGWGLCVCAAGEC